MRGAYPEGEDLRLLLCRNRDVGDQRVYFKIEFFQLEVTKLEMRWIGTAEQCQSMPLRAVVQLFTEV